MPSTSRADAWALDLGTRNSVLSRWRAGASAPEIMVLPDVARHPAVDDPLLAPHVVPTAVDVRPDDDVWSRLGRHPWLSARVLWGRRGAIGRAALDRHASTPGPELATSFKHLIARAPTAPVARVGDRPVSARDALRLFARELVAEVRRDAGVRLRELVVTAPVDAFEAYRAEVRNALQAAGVRRVRFLDEPVAAAVGYGLGLQGGRQVLVVDFGSGTLDLALVRLTARDAEAGRSVVVAKAGRPVGGDHVDAWLLDHLCADLGVRLDAAHAFWRAQLLDEARRAKEASFAPGEAPFSLDVPGHVGLAVRRARGLPTDIAVSQSLLADVLAARGLPTTLEGALDEVLDSARRAGSPAVDEVLLVGGSTLLPGVHELFERRFGRDRVRGWRPFEAVAFGAAGFAAGAAITADHLVHDYAIEVHDARTGAVDHVTIVQRGTPFPTAPDHWRRQLVPTCPLGEPERLFKLVICEISEAREDERLFGRTAAGEVRVLRAGQPRLVVPLNAAAPTLGTLDPPHAPSDRAARLDVSLGVDEARWLVATVRDLRTGRTLMPNQPVIRLLSRLKATSRASICHRPSRNVNALCEPWRRPRRPSRCG